MAIPTLEQKLRWLKPEPPSSYEQECVKLVSLGQYEIGVQRTNDLLDEAMEVFMRSSRSSIGIAGDSMVALFTAGGDLANASCGTYLHAIIQPILIKYILANYSENPGVKDGDIWYTNDALYGGIHNPDQLAIVPIFYDGTLLGWTGAAVHTTETGATEPGGMPVSASSRFEEGMNLPPIKIGENGVLREDMLEMVAAYGIRAPQMFIIDLKARVAGCERARQRVVEMCDRYGPDFVVGLLRRMLETAEQGARTRIASWPDGTYRSVHFSDAVGIKHGLVRSCFLSIHKQGDRLTFDFTGTSPENLSSYNTHAQSAVGHISNYIYEYVFHDLPISSATFAPIDFTFPPGICLNPDARAATSNAVMIATGAMSAVHNCFAKAMFPSRAWRQVTASHGNAGNALIIAGLSQWGLPFADMLAYSINTEGQGGRATEDGIDAFGFPWCVYGRAPNVESMENEFPLFIPFSQHWRDSCGHGLHRGGVGTTQLWVGYHNVPALFFASIADNSKIQTPQPLFGGYAPCTVPGISITNADVLEKMQSGADITLDLHDILRDRSIDGNWSSEFFGRVTRPVASGDVITVSFATGGAGYGDPLERDPEAVLHDLKAHKISPWVAENIYKVVTSSDGETVDLEATRQMRAAERQSRLQRGKSYDEFMAEWEQLKPPDEILTWFGAWPTAEPTQPIFRP
ncbi:MAG: hydantoinase B/oxoprolinase family protein [Ardenticatenaceae bacterium]|nr:hydantoinase B/oxoprolinase family protein [Ardenticatenaceae bacterium]HBY94036.1 acetophenone carboxylase [Chloroflexota bacterium]